QALLQTFRAPIEDYRAHVGQRADHPLTARNHGPVQVQGCWSVRLHSGGFHVNHVHPQGWISSACYLSVPDEAQDADRKAGWLKFGEVRYPAPGAGPERFVQPRPGRLVLFPSYMWHGTNPIIGPGPRVTVAFDAAPALRAHSAAASQARF